MVPASLTARETGASFSKDKCVLISIAGGIFGARLAMSPQARKWVFLLLVVVISAELVHLAIHYVFKTA